MPELHNIAVSRSKSLGTFCLFFPDSMDLYSSKYSKRFIKKRSLQILIGSQLQAKYLVITQEKDEGVKMVLSYLFQHVSVKLHMI